MRGSRTPPPTRRRSSSTSTSCSATPRDELARAAAFGLPQTGYGDLLSWRARLFRDVLEAASATADRLSERLVRFGALMASAATAATDEERMQLLQRAELLVATSPTSPLPASPADLHADGRRPAASRSPDGAISSRGSPRRPRTTLSGLLADVAAIPLADVDAEGLDLAPFVGRIVVLAGSLHDRLTALAQQIDAGSPTPRPRSTRMPRRPPTRLASRRSRRRTRRCSARRRASSASSRCLPRQAAEWSAALQAAGGGELLGHLTTRPFPVDDWLHGAARVREKLRQLEQTVLLSEALGPDEPSLVPIQLPHVPGEPWLGLEYPAGTAILGERLLYTAHYGVPFDAAADQCGLLLDEWTEVLPGTQETTGIAFHYDRPSSEPPQSWLLVVPPDPAAAWTFADVVDAVGETLDLARLRAVEPDDLDALPWARFLPAVDHGGHAAPDHDLGRSRPVERLAAAGGGRWLTVARSSTWSARSPAAASRPSPSGTASRAALAAPTSRAACGPRCAIRSGCSRASGSSESSRRTTRGRPSRPASQLATSRLTGYQAGSSPGVALPRVRAARGDGRARSLPRVTASALGLDLRLVLGRRFLALVKDIGDYRDVFCARYPIVLARSQRSGRRGDLRARRGLGRARGGRGASARRRRPVRPPDGRSGEPGLRRRPGRGRRHARPG